MTLLNPQQIEHERMRSLAHVFARADTTLVGRQIKCEVVEQPGLQAPGYSIGDSIKFNHPHIGSVHSTDDVIKVTGLNFHELAHAEYTPRKNDNLTQRLVRQHLWRFFNMLEDQRIEYLFTTMYPATEPYFVSTVMNYIADPKGDLSTAHILTHGRRYLPAKIRKALADNFDPNYDRPAIEKIIDEFRLLVLPRDTNKAFDLTEEFARLIKNSNAAHMGDPFGHDKPSRPDNKDEEPGQSQSQSEGSQQKQREAQQAGDPWAENDDDSYMGDDDNENDDSEGEDSDGSGDDDGEGDSASDDQGDGSGGDESGDDASGDSGSEGDGESDGSASGDADGDSASDGEDSSGGAGGDAEGGDDESDGDDSADGDVKSAGGGKDGKGKGEDLSPEDIRNLADLVGSNARRDPAVINDAKIKQSSMQRVRGQAPDLPYYPTQLDTPVPPKLNIHVRKFKKELQRLVADADPAWETHKASGRVNVNRAMRGEDLDTLWDQWNEGKQDASSIEVVVLVDASTSMSSAGMKAASESAWVIKRSVESIGGEVTVMSFSNSAYTMQSKQQKASAGTYVYQPVISGTDPNEGLDQANLVMHYSTKKHKIVIILTDGIWQWSDHIYAEDKIEQLAKHGVITALGYIDDEASYNREVALWASYKKNNPNGRGDRAQDMTHRAQVFRRLDSATGLIDLAKDLVKRAMNS